MIRIGVIGPGRAGLGLGLALAQAGFPVALHGRARRGAYPPELKLTFGGPPPWLPEVDVVVIAVPDDAIATVADELHRSGRVRPSQVVLHLSGALDSTALRALRPTGAALGSFHPLQTLAQPATAPERLRGAIAVIEGDDRAVARAREVAQAIGLVPASIRTGAKALYHAGAVFGSNYVVALAAIAQDLLEQSGLPPAVAWQGVLALMTGALENLKQGTAETALTGPVARGDSETVRRHVAALNPETAEVYRALARAAARLAPLSPDQRSVMTAALQGGETIRTPLGG